ncbi:class I SAM-dependent methyltransferase [Methylacidiphilum caldifontis]|uniref:SAM-dependent methyltransferase n=1 Tax=Methylacidiphilum caldifontis TaxID=2795386 RepID=A0A4Y8PB20_9BACT|nr:methyltransferase domain-containing protein [Methylacidiphilum caldifontis]QSR88142.1 class I SAM-dependent methyltransferase [Methylacidiphilum caldifontis]TFE68180.1 SAM-dependent methyltransferase [Methylacidiphilum caldifontis]
MTTYFHSSKVWLWFFYIIFFLTLCRGFSQEMESSSIEQKAKKGFHHSFHDVKRYAQMFESKERDQWQKPDRVIEALDIKPGYSIADIGAGTGYFSRRFSQAVGEKGKVYALDSEPAMVRYMKKEIKEKNLKNVVVKQVDPNNPQLNNRSVNIIFLCEVYHHMDNRIEYLKRLSSALKRGGKVALIDFYPSSPYGPPSKHRLSESEVIAEFKAAGYKLLKKHHFLAYQYFLEFVPMEQGS